MANKIEMAEGKTLKLNNVLMRVIDSSDASGFQKTSSMFESYTKANKLDLYGPPIIRVESTILGNSARTTTTLMGQVRNAPEKVDSPYDFAPQVRVEGCLMARYHGPLAAIQMAYSKIQVYAFENNISLGGTTYTVYLKNGAEGESMADIFTEVVH